MVCAWSVAYAVPAKPGVQRFTQTDGSVIEVRLLGDEWHHSFVTADEGIAVEMDEKGDFYYRTTSGVSTVRAHNKTMRAAGEQAFVSAHAPQMTFEALAAASPRVKAAARRGARAASAPRKVGATQVPVTGSPRVPIILVEYTDKKMSNTVEAFKAQYTSGAKSVFQYFSDQSNGKYTPQFDVYGIYPLASTRATYGGNSGGNDKGVARMVGEAIDKAGNDIDWSLYDNDGDGEADVCIVVYAGVGEAQSSVSNSVWPCQWELSSGAEWNDGTGARTRNGVTIDRFAVFNEVGGSSDRGKVLDGIGTFCHEFSHCLGLPDFYATNYAGYYGMGNWSLMCGGCYNGYANGVDGVTPVGYTAYEKEFMGWVELKTLQPGRTYTLRTWNAKSEETDVAYKIVSDLNPNEYFILSNRRQQGWDAEIADEGMLIEHVTFVQSRWDDNTPNDKSVQLMTIMPADNSLSDSNENADCWGESKHEFTNTSTPAAKLNMKANGTLASNTGGVGLLNKPVTDIKINADGTVSFIFMEGEGGIEVSDPVLLDADAEQVTTTSFTAAWTDETDAENVVSYTLQVDQDGYVPEVPLFEQLLDEDFSVPASTTWTRSASGTFNENTAGYLRLGGNSGTGSVTSPTFQAGGFDGVVTVKVRARSYSIDTDVQMKVTLLNAAGTAVGSETFEVAKTDSVFVAKFTGASGNCRVRIENTAAKKRVMLGHATIFAGDPTQEAAAGAPRRVAAEEGDEHTRIITGITDKQYTVEGLVAGATYNFKVKAIYVDETESEWTAVKQVTLQAAAMPLKGDVNKDGEVGIADITALSVLLLEGTVVTDADMLYRADMNSDGEVGIADVTSLITVLLGQDTETEE